jgi:hypothetical protein
VSHVARVIGNPLAIACGLSKIPPPYRPLFLSDSVKERRKSTRSEWFVCATLMLFETEFFMSHFVFLRFESRIVHLGLMDL